MTIHPLLQHIPLAPEDIGRLVEAYEATLEALELTNRGDPITEIVAQKVIEIGQTGVRDPRHISNLAIKALGPAAR